MDPIYSAVNLEDVADPQTLWDTALEGVVFRDEVNTPEGPAAFQDEA